MNNLLSQTKLSVPTDLVEAMEVVGNKLKVARWYQIAAKNQTVRAITNNLSRRILIKMPTGSGKTHTIQMVVSDYHLQTYLKQLSGLQAVRILYMSHLHRLLTQSKRGFGDYTNVRFIDDTNYETSHFNNAVKPAEFDGKHDIEIMYHSIRSELPEGIEFDLVIMDEFHHEACVTVQYLLEYVHAHVPMIGMTATDERPDNFLLKFDFKVEPLSRDEAVRQGFLAETDLYSFVDITGKDKSGIVCRILNLYQHQMEGTMIFLRTKAECRVVTDYIRKNFNRTVVFIDKQSKQEVDRILDEFSKGNIEFLVNCQKLGEGVDVAGCSDVIIGVNVGSYPKLNQIIGRTSRPDSDSRVYELINPLSSTNKDTTLVIGIPRSHTLCYERKGEWVFEMFMHEDTNEYFDYTEADADSYDDDGEIFSVMDDIEEDDIETEEV